VVLEFKFRAPRYLQASPVSDWEWLFLMQHYGLPTRLLDWTESALIGMYFALRDNRGDCDAAVWMLNPWWLNKQSLGKYKVPQAGDKRLVAWAPLEAGGELHAQLPVAIKPIQASRASQTKRDSLRSMVAHAVHSTSSRTHRRTKGPACEKSPFQERPRACVADIRRELAIAGITETTVFPELDGLCREIMAGFLGY